jgi:hypothetical protein
MALDKNQLTTAIIDAATAHPDGGAEAMAAIGEAVEAYLVDNTAASYSWTAANASTGAPDTTTSFDAELEKSGATFSSTPDDFEGFISDLADFLGGIKIKAPSGFSVSPLESGAGTFTAEQLGDFTDPEDGEAALKEAHGKIAQGIIDGWPSYFAPATTGTHSQTFTGGGALTGVR